MGIGYASIDCGGRPVGLGDVVRVVGIPVPQRNRALSPDRDLEVCRALVGRYRVVLSFNDLGLVRVRVRHGSDEVLHLEPDLLRVKQTQKRPAGPTLSERTALRLAREFLSTRFSDEFERLAFFVIDRRPPVFVVGYQAKEHLRTKGPMEALYGNGPILVDRRSRAVLSLESGEPYERQVRRYLDCGHPNPDSLEPDIVLRRLRTSRRRERERGTNR